MKSADTRGDERAPPRLSPAPARDPVPVRAYAAPASGRRLAVRRVEGESGVYPPHKHDYFQILVFLGPAPAGRIGLKAVEPGRGSVWCIAPMTPHQVRFEPDTRCWVVAFDLGVLRPGLGAAIPLPDLVRRAPELTPFLHQGLLDYRLDRRGLANVERLLRGLEADSRRTGLAAREAAGAGLTLLLATLCRTFEPRFAVLAGGDGAPAQAERRLARVAAYLADAYRGEVTLAAAAEAAHVTPTHLCHLLKAHTGKTLGEIVTEMRLDEARQRLVYTDAPIAEIAFSVGYGDVKYFQRRFKRATGTTPGRFRADGRSGRAEG
jgi:AraC-like DNA-binding protein/quercetin dioxygenase-like cupin family protein